MVGGLDRFRAHFLSHLHQYALIGGSACDLLLDRAGLSFRATRDLDIVLFAESMDARFGRDFWRFVRDGEYEVAQTAGGTPARYRFVRPRAAGFPAMLEILSIRPPQMGPSDHVNLTPLPFEEGVSSLSAILLDDDYYAFLKTGVQQVEGISVVGATHLIPLKARAWLDLTDRKAGGVPVQSRDVSKHRRDVFRLYRIVEQAPLEGVPRIVRDDMGRFISATRHDPMDLKGLGISRSSLEEVLDQIGTIYGTR